MNKAIGVLTGNGVGFEAMGAARSVLEEAGDFIFREALIGVAAIEDCGDPLPLVSRRVIKASHAVLLGAVKGLDWEATDDPRAPHPDTAVVTLEKTMSIQVNPPPLTVFVTEAAGVTAPIIMPSVRLNKHSRGIFTPASPEGMDNPFAWILSAAAALRYSLGMPDEAARIEGAAGQALDDGVRTPDLGGDASIQQVTDAVMHNLNA